MNNELTTILENRFYEYYNSLEIKDSDTKWNLEMKKAHSLRVKDNIIELCDFLNLDNEQTNLAKTLALFHDIGRFSQYIKYNTFKDSDSENHAELGLKVIEEKSFFDGIPKSSKEILQKAIFQHNRKELPINLSERETLFCKLIRDADKLDIFHVVLSYYEDNSNTKRESLELGLPNNANVSKKIYSDLREGIVVNISDVHSLNDFKLLQIGWIYDINFIYSYKKIKEEKFIERLFAQLPDIKLINNLHKEIDDFIEIKIINLK